jgi:tetratricopeptide (TPR) repeat protein
MDTEHRHELKTNELADWIVHLPGFLRKNWAQITGVVLIVVALLVIPLFKRTRQSTTSQHQADTTQLIQKIAQEKVTMVSNQKAGIMETQSQFLVAAGSLEDAAKKEQSPYPAALALIKRAEALRADLHFQSTDVSQSTVAAQISQARKAYELAIEKAKGNNTLTAMAKIGLGLCAEEVGKVDRAREIYEEIIANTDFAATMFSAQAQFRLDAMDDNRTEFVFVAAPQPEPQAFELDIPQSLAPESTGQIIAPQEPQTVEGETAENQIILEPEPGAETDQAAQSESGTD